MEVAVALSEQSLYDLLARTIELEVIPAAQANGIGIIPWSPLQGGPDAALRALDFTLDASALERLDAIFPGHRPAPEDYAW